MKIRIITTQQVQYELEVEPEDTIISVKLNIELLQKIPVASQQLIYKGKFLDNAYNLAHYQIKSNDKIVIYVKSSKPDKSAKNENNASGQQVASVNQTPIQTPVPTPDPAPPSSVSPTRPALVPVTVDSNLPPASQYSHQVPDDDPEFESCLQQIVDMGFNRTQAIIALKTSLRDPDVAVHYLLSGENLLDNQSPSQDIDFLPTSEMTASGLSSASQNYLANSEQGSRDGNVSIPSLFSHFVNDPEFNAIRTQIQQNPAFLDKLLQNLADMDPKIIGVINDNMDEFVQFLKEPPEPLHGEMADGDKNDQSGLGGYPELYMNNSGNDGVHLLDVNQEESEAIDRLCGLGFDKQRVIEAFFSCDKDEQLAANLLLESNDDD